MAFNWEQITKDFQQKYEKTFIRVKVRDEFEVFFVTKVHRGEPPYLLLKNSKYGEIQLNYDTDYEISFDYPEIGMFDSKPGIALLCARRFQRQWKRGMSDDTVLFACPYNRFLQVIPTEACEHLLTEAFSLRKIRTLDEALYMLQGRVLSICLTSSFSIGQDVREGNKQILWYLTSPVAEITGNLISVREPVFTQEIRDYLRQFGGAYAIV